MQKYCLCEKGILLKYLRDLFSEFSKQIASLPLPYNA